MTTPGKSPNPQPPARAVRRIVLTGFMGSGKTTVGPLVAARLGWSFVDADDVIEADAGATIADLFASRGEAAFRELERASIERLARRENLVLALGGGAIEQTQTRELLLNSDGAFFVHLEVEFATALSRCGGTEQIRPVFADKASLKSRYDLRLPLYRMAHVSIAVDRLTPNQVAESILLAAGL